MPKKPNKRIASDILGQALAALGGEMPRPQPGRGVNSSLNLFAAGGEDGIDRDPRLEILRRNTLAQTAYTPEAKQTLQNIPLRLLLDGPQNAGGKYTADTNTVRMQKELLDPEKAQLAIDILRHEFNHALDPNVKSGAGGVSSQEFNNNYYAAASPQDRQGMDAFQKNEFAIPGYQQNTKRQDIEGYAQVGAQGQDVLLSNPAIAAYYKKTFAPYTPALNYTPKYSAKPRR